MKILKRLSLIAALFAVFSVVTMAQANITATASATIVTPISIAKTTDMNFGNVAIGAVAGDVVLSPAAVRTPTNATLPATTGTVTAAVFTVTGTTGFTYSITLPSVDHTITDGTNTMIVNTFVSTPSGTGTLTGGTETLSVGATLNISGSQAAGTYTSVAPFTVTVNYN